MNNGAKIN